MQGSARTVEPAGAALILACREPEHTAACAGSKTVMIARMEPNNVPAATPTAILHDRTKEYKMIWSLKVVFAFLGQARGDETPRIVDRLVVVTVVWSNQETFVGSSPFGSPAACVKPVALRPRLATGLPLSWSIAL